MTLYWNDRQYVSQYAIDTVGLSIVQNQVPLDADGTVSVSMTNENTGAVIFTRTANHLGVGDYATTFNSSDTSIPGMYTIRWDYEIATEPQYFEGGIEIGPASPAYDNLPDPMKGIIESVWVRMADLLDSPGGGPNALTYVQSKFGRGRVAELLRIALGRMNTMAQPFQTYTLDGNGGAQFPYAQWGSLLESMTWAETIKHLIRIYTEQPQFMGSGNVSRLDRRDYVQRWRDVLMEEEQLIKSQLDVFKIASMGLGRPAVLISGGVYGRYGPTRMAGSVAARPRYWTRYY
jgi:hypothetical protein